jgi:hypothetical protein
VTPEGWGLPIPVIWECETKDAEGLTARLLAFLSPLWISTCDIARSAVTGNLKSHSSSAVTKLTRILSSFWRIRT